MTESSDVDDGPRRVSPLTALRRAWLVAALLTMFGLVLGLGYADTRQVTYTAESRVAVGTGSLSASAVAGYTIGVESIAADYARSVTTDDAISHLTPTLGNAVSGVLAVNASPLPSSAVIRVDVDATSSDLALKAVTAVTTTFVNSINAQVSSRSPATVLKSYQAVQAKLVPAQTQQQADQAELAALRAQTPPVATKIAAAQAAVNQDAVTVSTLTTQASALNLQYQNLVSSPAAENGLRRVQSASLIGSNERSLVERYALLGLAVGVLLALAAATWLDSRRVRAERLVRPQLVPDPVEVAADEPAVPRLERAGRPRLVPDLAEASSRVRGTLHRLRPVREVVEAPAPPPPARPAVAPTPSLSGDPYLREALRAALEQQTRELEAARSQEAELQRRAARDAARVAELSGSPMNADETDEMEAAYELLPWLSDESAPDAQSAPISDQSALDADSAPMAAPISEQSAPDADDETANGSTAGAATAAGDAHPTATDEAPPRARDEPFLGVGAVAFREDAPALPEPASPHSFFAAPEELATASDEPVATTDQEPAETEEAAADADAGADLDHAEPTIADAGADLDHAEPTMADAGADLDYAEPPVAGPPQPGEVAAAPAPPVAVGATTDLEPTDATEIPEVAEAVETHDTGGAPGTGVAPGTGEAHQTGATPESGEALETAAPPETVEAPDAVEDQEFGATSEPAGSPEAVEPVDAPEAVEPVDAPEVVEPVNATESLEPVEPVDAPDAPEAVEPVDAPESPEADAAAVGHVTGAVEPAAADAHVGRRDEPMSGELEDAPRAYASLSPDDEDVRPAQRDFETASDLPHVRIHVAEPATQQGAATDVPRLPAPPGVPRPWSPLLDGPAAVVDLEGIRPDGAEAEAQARVAEPEPGPELEPVADVEPEPGPGPELEPVADVEPEPVAEVESEVESAAEVHPEPLAEVEPDVDVESAAEVHPEPLAEVEPEPLAEVEPEWQAADEPELELASPVEDAAARPAYPAFEPVTFLPDPAIDELLAGDRWVPPTASAPNDATDPWTDTAHVTDDAPVIEIEPLPGMYVVPDPPADDSAPESAPEPESDGGPTTGTEAASEEPQPDSAPEPASDGERDEHQPDSEPDAAARLEGDEPTAVPAPPPPLRPDLHPVGSATGPHADSGAEPRLSWARRYSAPSTRGSL